MGKGGSGAGAASSSWAASTTNIPSHTSAVDSMTMDG